MTIKDYRYMTLEQRKALEEMHRSGVPLTEISRTLGVHLATLYRELKRGGAERPGDAYSAMRAEYVLKDNLKKRGRKSA